MNKKILMLAASAALVSSFTGCFGSDDDTDGSSAISGFGITVSGDTATVAGTVSIADSTVMVEFIVNGDETFPKCDEYPSDSATSFDFGALGCIVDPIDMVNGSNTVTINVIAGTDTTASETVTFTIALDSVDPGLTDVPMESEAAVTLGAQGAAAGSSLDLDTWTVYTSSEITTAVAPNIDVVLYNTADGLSLMTADEAIALSYLTSKLVEGNVTMMFPVDVTEAEFAAIENFADLPDFDAVEPVTSAVVTTGDVMIITTDKLGSVENAGVFIVRVEAATSGNSGTISVKGLHP